jgi:F-type H+-transporting ATPase subunit b
MSEEASLISNPTVWYAGAMAVFFAGVLRYASKPILGALDVEIDKIRKELEEAKRLRAEAAASLEEYRSRQKAALSEATKIIEQAKKDAARVRAEAEAEMKASLERHERKAAERISMAEEEALAEVRAAVIEEAVAIARRTLESKLDVAAIERLAGEAIAEAPKIASAKTKAA